MVEVYSPPRVVPICQKRSLSGCWSLDRVVRDADGKAWDFDDPAMRLRAQELIRKTRPWLLIGSPMCIYFSNIMDLAKGRMAPGEFERRLAHAIDHLRLMFSLFKLQMSLGGYIWFEHLKDATSWFLEFVVAMMWQLVMKFVIAHPCCFGMCRKDHVGTGSVLKPIRFITDCVARSSFGSPALRRPSSHLYVKRWWTGSIRNISPLFMPCDRQRIDSSAQDCNSSLACRSRKCLSLGAHRSG